jgi:hypothetical protein
MFANTSTLEGVAFVSQPGNPLANDWLDKTAANSQYDALARKNPTAYNLFEATAAAMGHNKTGKGLFSDLVDQSVYESTLGNRYTPMDLLYPLAFQHGVLNADGTFNAAAAKPKSGADGPKLAQYGTSTATSSNVTHADPDTARGLVDNALQTYLGVRASPERVDQFLADLRAHENKNPDKATRTTTTSANGTTTADSASTGTSGGGSNPQQYAEDWARGQQGAAEFQASTSYLDSFLEAIKNPMDVVQ